MSRLCGRPGCSEPGAAAYGIVPEDLLFWVDVLDARPDPDVGVLCRRHADSMVVPLGWTLDDRREPVPRLFRPPVTASPAAVPAARPPRRRRSEGDDTEQLVLPDSSAIPDDVDAATAHVPDAGPAAADADPPPGWTPRFDTDDDLNGLLEVRSPLLARAFRGADRPRP